jgi:hypothetical protein
LRRSANAKTNAAGAEVQGKSGSDRNESRIVHGCARVWSQRQTSRIIMHISFFTLFPRSELSLRRDKPVGGGHKHATTTLPCQLSTPVAPSLRVCRYASRSQSMSRFLFNDNNRNFGSCPASSAMRPCRVHTISDSVAPIVFPSDDPIYRSVPSLCWLPPSLRFAPLSGTMNGLRQPCNRPRRFVALSTPDSIPAIVSVPVFGLHRSVAYRTVTESLLSGSTHPRL